MNGCIRKPLGNGIIRDCTCVAIIVVVVIVETFTMIADIPTGSQDGNGFQQRIYTMVMHFSVGGRRKASTTCSPAVPVVVGRGVRICSRHRVGRVRTESSQGTWKGWQ